MARPLPEEMTVVEITRPGPPDVLRPARRPVPRPRAGDALIRVAAAGVVVRDLPGTPLVRASVGAWNDEGDLERLLTTLEAGARGRG